MPTVPEPLPPPSSLGGLLNFTEDLEEETTISGLMERTSETTEDIEERREIAEAIESIEKESEQIEQEKQVEEEI